MDGFVVMSGADATDRRLLYARYTGSYRCSPRAQQGCYMYIAANFHSTPFSKFEISICRLKNYK